LLCSTEPKIINATKAVDVVLKFNYRIAPADIYVIGKKIEKGTASDKEKKLFFEIKELRRYAVDYNVTLKRISKTSMKNMKIGTPLHAIFFHIYCFLKFGIKFKSIEHDFGQLVSYLVSSDESLKDIQLQKLMENNVPARVAKTNTTKVKSSWVERCEKSGYTINKRKYILFPKQTQSS
jgi:hypothetical protein